MVQPWTISKQLERQRPTAQAGLQVSQSREGKTAYTTENNKVSPFGCVGFQVSQSRGGKTAYTSENDK